MDEKVIRQEMDDQFIGLCVLTEKFDDFFRFKPFLGSNRIFRTRIKRSDALNQLAMLVTGHSVRQPAAGAGGSPS